jgi:ABC-2 type transport system ATP-binding protein
MKRRLLVAKAMVHSPPILVLDEPTAGVDIEIRRDMWRVLKEINAAGTTIILTTHYLEEADQLAERVVVIDRGVVVADASPAEIKSRVLGRRVSFTADRPLSDADFEGLPYQNLEVEGNRVRLLSNAPEALLRELFRRGYDIRDLQVVGADLEEAFLDLTRHAEKETVA